jgi:hypothetical protein
MARCQNEKPEGPQGGNDSPVQLSEADRSNLAGLEAKLQLVRDYVGEVVAGLSTGLYLYGEGGSARASASSLSWSGRRPISRFSTQG